MPAPTARQKRTRIVLVLVQVIAIGSSVIAPLSTFADEDPTTPSAVTTPAPTESPPAPSPTEIPATPAPTESPLPATPAPLPATPAPTAAAATTTPALPAGTLPYIVTFAPGTPDVRQAEILAAVGVTDVSSIPQLAMHGVLLHEWMAGDEVSALRAFAEVARVDEDRTREAGALPSDAQVDSQWALEQIGWTDLYGTAAPAGSAVVAVLDTGIDGSHPDLDGVVLSGVSMLDGGDGLSDPNGHGTAMAGIVAAETDNGFGVAGTAWVGVSVMPVTVLDAAGLGQDSDIIGGVVHAADAGADVILMAFSNPGYSPALQSALDYAWSRGALLVAAVGNDGSTAVTYPAGDRGVIGVAATDASDALTAGSNAGGAAFMAAPGLDILTTAVGGGTGWVSGSSASAAEVAGAAAMLRALDPSASNGAIVGRLARNADVTASAGTGNGRLNMARAAADASTEEVQPAGAAPLGSGGPIVGPYVAASNATITGTVRSAATDNPAIVGATVTCVAGCNDGPAVTTASGAYSLGVEYAGSATITLRASAAGYASTELSITPGNGNAGTKTLNFVLTPANTPPVANGDSYATDEDTALLVSAPGVLGNDTDADGNPLSAVLVTGPTAAQGVLSLGADGSFTFTPAANFNGPATFSYRANDGTADSNTATVTISVTAVDDAPTAVNDSASVAEDAGETTIDVLENDTDADGGPMAVTSVSQPGHGSSAVTNGGADVSYTPAADFCGSDTLSYTLNGGSSATVAVSVTCANDAPVAADDSASVSEDSVANQIFVLGNDSDVDGDTLTVVGVTQPTAGSASAQLGYVTYTPNPDYNGPDSFTYTITDGQGGTATALVTVSVGAVNDAPAAANDTYSTSEDVALSVVAPGVLANDGDVDLDTLGASLVDDAAHGVLVLNADGSFTYTPSADFHGTDGFTYAAGDGAASSDVATVTITVISVNDAPVLAAIGPQATDEEVELAFNASASDVDGDALTFELADGVGGDVPAGAGISTGGAFSWTPDEAQGPDVYTFDVCVSDGVADPACETITVTVNEVNVAPVLDPIGGQTVDEGSSVTFTATATDADLPANGLSFGLANGVGSVPIGASIDAATGAFSWTPADDGIATFDVCATDDGVPALSDCETITITVDNVAPVVDAGAGATIDEGGTFIGSGSFTDPGADAWSATVDYGDGSGIQPLTLNPDRTFALDHLYADDGSYTVTVSVNDDDASGSDTLTVTVENVAPEYTAAANQSSLEGEATSFDVGSFTDPGADSPWRVTIQWGDGSTNTVLSRATPGTIPAQSHTYADNGTYIVTVTVTEENGAGPGSDSATFQVVVANVAPTITGTFLSIDPVTRIVSASASWTDPGVDTYSATFAYFIDGAPTPAASRTVVPSPASSTTAADNLTQLPAGCYTLTMLVTVTDDDSGVGIGQQSTTGPVAVHAAAFQAPIRDNERNIAKYGNVVPVKVLLTNPCSGASVTTPSLFVTIVQGNVSDDSIDDTPNLVAESVSSADAGSQMRLSGAGYIYNFGTKQLKAGNDYTIRIRVGDVGGPIIAKALFQPKK